jgi:hypothetical protein
MGDKLSKPTAPGAIDRREYLKHDLKRFIDPKDAGPAKVLTDHDPYEVVERPNPNGCAMVEAILTWDGSDPGPENIVDGIFVVPERSVLLDADRVGRFWLTQDAAFVGGPGDVIVGAIAIEPGVQGNVDCHTLIAVRGYPGRALRADNPYPAMGGADIVNGALVTGGGPPRPKLEEIRANQRNQALHEGDLLALKLLGGLGVMRLELPGKWPNIVVSAVTAKRFNAPIRLVTVMKDSGATLVLLEHEGDRIGLAFRHGKLTSVREES